MRGRREEGEFEEGLEEGEGAFGVACADESVLRLKQRSEEDLPA